MKIGAVSLGWSGQPLPQVMDEIAAMGGECIEINGRSGLHAGLTLDCRERRRKCVAGPQRPA